jgi:hypothetical protein
MSPVHIFWLPMRDGASKASLPSRCEIFFRLRLDIKVNSVLWPSNTLMGKTQTANVDLAETIQLKPHN